METAQDRFKLLTRDMLAPALRALGFKGSGQHYVLPDKDHWAVLGIQRSYFSDRRTIRFTRMST